jgi:transposase
MTLADIAGWLSLSWDTVRTVVQRRLEKDYRRIGDRKVRAIAIDELYLGRTRKYITLVIDLQSGRIIWVEQGRGRDGVVDPPQAASGHGAPRPGTSARSSGSR